jgi:hypothetical protein
MFTGRTDYFPIFERAETITRSLKHAAQEA